MCVSVCVCVYMCVRKHGVDTKVYLSVFSYYNRSTPHYKTITYLAHHIGNRWLPRFPYHRALAGCSRFELSCTSGNTPGPLLLMIRGHSV